VAFYPEGRFYMKDPPMKLAVIADIHGNYAALQTVVAHIDDWQPDLVVVAGDIVNRGPRPRECLELVRNRQQTEGWLTVRGNHEDYVLNYTRPELTPTGLEFEIFRSAYWTYEQLNGHVATLAAMPFQVDLAGPSGHNVRVVHASMNGTQDGIFPMTSEGQLRQKIRAAGQSTPTVFCVGHTHCPLVRSIDNTLVVNVGAVGLPFDGDHRAAYGQLSWQEGQWHVEIIRLDYDRQLAEQDFFESGYFDRGGPLIRLILDELHIAQSHLYRWTQAYQAQTIAGEITLDEAVTAYLEGEKKVDYDP
jgi:predicted phosphodiesterase